MKITINNQELEFNFKYSQLKKLCEKLNKNLGDLKEIAADFNNASLLAAIGTGKDIETIEQLLDADGSFEAIQNIIKAFSDEVIQYIGPNLQSQAD